jgi:uncharacterized RDD family membrane protein YckC
VKCPKCGYVGFESVDRCRNCGYHFSLAESGADVELHIDTEPDVLPPADFDFANGLAGPPRERRPAAPDTDFDLPPHTPVPATPVDLDLPLFGPDRAKAGPAARPVSRAPQPVRGGLAPGAAPGSPAPPGAGSPSPRTPRLRPRPQASRAETFPLEPEPPREEPLRSLQTVAARPAGPIARLVAGLLDVLILAGLDLTVLYFTLRVLRLSFGDITVLPVAPLVGFFLLLDGAYLVAFTVNGGQTIGKMAASIRVVADDGERVATGQAILRVIGYVASALPAGLGFVPGLFGPVRRALHDRLANTRVIKL